MENVMYLLILADALTLVALIRLWFVYRKHQLEVRMLFAKFVGIVEAQREFNEVVVEAMKNEVK
jgi:hypothetical protein